TLAREFVQRRTLAKAVGGGGEDVAPAGGHDHRHHPFAVGEPDATDATRGATHRTHLVLGETYRLAVRGEKHDVIAAAGQGHVHEAVTLVQMDRPDAGAARTRERRHRRLLHHALGGSE